MSLKLYTDYVSQPCRAVHLLLEANKVPYEAVVLELRTGECGAVGRGASEVYVASPSVYFMQ